MDEQELFAFLEKQKKAVLLDYLQAAFAEMGEHHAGREDQGDGIGQALAGQVGSAAVDRLEHGIAGADIRARDHAQTAHQAGT